MYAANTWKISLVTCLKPVRINWKHVGVIRSCVYVGFLNAVLLSYYCVKRWIHVAARWRLIWCWTGDRLAGNSFTWVSPSGLSWLRTNKCEYVASVNYWLNKKVILKSICEFMLYLLCVMVVVLHKLNEHLLQLMSSVVYRRWLSSINIIILVNTCLWEKGLSTSTTLYPPHHNDSIWGKIWR